jgi:hypothetical protein
MNKHPYILNLDAQGSLEAVCRVVAFAKRAGLRVDTATITIDTDPPSSSPTGERP